MKNLRIEEGGHTFEKKNLDEEFVVIASPWEDRLPYGTVIVRVKDKPDFFKRKDGKLLFDNEPHGTFKLFNNEYTKK